MSDPVILTYHIVQIHDTYANILASMGEWQMGFTTNAFGSVGLADDMIFENDSDEHYVMAKQFKIASDDTTVSYSANNFGICDFHSSLRVVNDTASDEDEGRNTHIDFLGTKDDDSVVEMGVIQVVHDGTGDDSYGRMDLGVGGLDGEFMNVCTDLSLYSNGDVEMPRLSGDGHAYTSDGGIRFVGVNSEDTISVEGGFLELSITIDGESVTRFVPLYTTVVEPS